MRLTTSLVSLAALVVGVGGGTAAFQLASTAGGPDAPTGSVATAATPAGLVEPAEVLPGTRFAWAPCEEPAVRRGRACVTEVVRTVVLPAAAAPAVPVPAPPAPQAPVGSSSDDGGEDGGHDAQADEPADEPGYDDSDGPGYEDGDDDEDEAGDHEDGEDQEDQEDHDDGHEDHEDD